MVLSHFFFQLEIFPFQDTSLLRPVTHNLPAVVSMTTFSGPLKWWKGKKKKNNSGYIFLALFFFNCWKLKKLTLCKELISEREVIRWIDVYIKLKTSEQLGEDCHSRLKWNILQLGGIHQKLIWRKTATSSKIPSNHCWAINFSSSLTKIIV